MDTLLDGFGVYVSLILVDVLRASLAMPLAFESSRARRETLEFDDPYEGFATCP